MQCKCRPACDDCTLHARRVPRCWLCREACLPASTLATVVQPPITRGTPAASSQRSLNCVATAMNVSGKGAFVTGGARGLGRGIVEILLSRGAKVFFCDISESNGRATEQELQKVYGASHVTFSQCDVTNSSQLKDVFEQAVSKLGAVEICVNNAGIMDERVWETMLDINTRATIRGCQLAFDHMDKTRGGKGGVIVNMVSIAGLFSEHFFPVYVATKHAVLGFTLSWAACMEDGKQGVSWACLCPDGCDTDLRRNLQEGQINDIPLQQPQQTSAQSGRSC
ncbi:15-hydroxyprostaglandin dehydrogenase [NAD(+)]-like [Pomacea canaliculata]|uniref:15-hydroxyprostaglandin dehydrogenase [NAD(+)]-like n=1 Tax=Pomacea canaliculata TaxID=400727 RepID=UPI000D7291A1|nr:15-hydroxyprostaglandin dehydrogenase [NAD(+)]-like [Pomacea canaliculata]